MAVDPIQFPTVPVVDVKTQRKVGRDGLGYVWEIDEPPVEFHVDYLDGRTGALFGEIAVKWKGSHLHMATINLSATRERQAIIDFCDHQTQGLGIPWGRLIERFCVAVLTREREGSPTQYPEPTESRAQTVYDVDNLAIQGKTNSLFAPGGSGKGYLSVAIVCAVMSQRGLGDLTTIERRAGYLDWEDNFSTFNDRINSVARGMNVPLPRIPYRRMRGLFSHRINEIARWVDEEELNFVVVDSFSAAGGTVTSNTSWDAIAHRFYDAVDLIPDVTWLIIDHVTGDAASHKQQISKAFGSIQKHNRVRNAWGMLNDQDPGSPVSHMRFYDGKWNHTGHRPAFGLRMTFTDNAVVFESEEPVEPVTSDENIPDRIEKILKNDGRQTMQDLAKKLGVQEGSIRMALTRDSRLPAGMRRFAKEQGQMGLVRILGQPVDRVVDSDGVVHETGDLPW